jgi:hypothetical protein
MPKTAKAKKVDLYKIHKPDYVTPKEPVLMKISPAKYLTIDGQGEPGGEEFQAKVGALYGAAYTIKMTKKFAGQDYKVCGLEGLWWCKDPKNWMSQPLSTWQWKLMIRVPEFIRAADLKQAAAKLAGKGKGELAREVRLETIKEGACIQILHVGPYANEVETVKRMDAFAAAKGLKPAGRHHEIYLSDPRRVAPEKLRTILRMPVTKPKKRPRT